MRYAVRMVSEREYASAEAGRLLARARWGSRGVEQAVETLVTRAGELPDDEVVRLRHAVNEEAARRGLVTRTEGRA